MTAMPSLPNGVNSTLFLVEIKLLVRQFLPNSKGLGMHDLMLKGPDFNLI